MKTILNDNLEMIELAEEGGQISLIVEAYDQIENLLKKPKTPVRAFYPVKQMKMMPI